MHTSAPLIIANWKSNFSWEQAKNWADSFSRLQSQNHTYIICPPFPLLGAVQGHDFAIGVQDLSPFEAGAYTGAVSPQNLDGLNVTYALLGHSERRMYFAETSHSVAQKVELAFAHGITPIVCVDMEQVSEQSAALSGLSAQQRATLVIAYEPVHSISTFGGKEDPIQVTLQNIEKIKGAFECETVLYGGSVSPDNSLTYLQPESISGLLVGGASLDPKQFAQI